MGRDLAWVRNAALQAGHMMKVMLIGAMSAFEATAKNFAHCTKFGYNVPQRPGTVILHSPADETIPFGDSEELLRNSGLSDSALIEVGTDHRLADPEPLAKMLEAAEGCGICSGKRHGVGEKKEQ